MLAQGADEVRGQLVALVEIAADAAHEAAAGFGLGGLGLGLGLDVGEIVGVGHGRRVGELAGLGDQRDVEHVGAAVDGLLHLARNQGVGGAVNVAQAVFARRVGPAGEFVHVAAALEAEVTEQVHRGRLGQDADVKDACALDHLVGEVLLVDAERDARGVFGQLGNGVDDAAAVAAVLTGGQHIQAVAEVEKSGGIKRHGHSSFECAYRMYSTRKHGC